MNTLLGRLDKAIQETPSGETRNTLTDAVIALHGSLNLFRTCKFRLPTCMTGTDDSVVEYGNGIGNDNIVKCKIYENE